MGLGIEGKSFRPRTPGESEGGLPVLDRLPGSHQRSEDHDKIKLENSSVQSPEEERIQGLKPGHSARQADWPKRGLCVA